MNRLALLSISILLLGAAGFLLSLNACGGGGGSARVTSTGTNFNLPHVVIIFQENRTPDNLFQGLCLPPNGTSASCNSVNPSASQYDIASSGTNSKGSNIPLSPLDLGTAGANPDTYDVDHSHPSFVEMCDLNSSTGICTMDGADLIPTECAGGALGCAPPFPNPQFKYVSPVDVQPYFTMAEHYTFADHMFQTNQGPSFPAHQFILGGTSAPTATSNLFASENGSSGCISPPTARVELIDPAGSETSNAPI